MAELIDSHKVFPSGRFLTIDVEDWHRLMSTYYAGSRDSDGVAFERQLDICLEILALNQSRGTFFCLGSSLVDKPHLVRLIAGEGHEIASHGWEHEQISKTGLVAFREDLSRSIGWLEQLTGRKVRGFRAPRFGVSPSQVEQFFEICVDAGLSYDSSIYPISGWRYGVPGGEMQPHFVRTTTGRRLVEFPIATRSFFGKVWPVGGGGWWRILPEWLLLSILDEYHKSRGVFMTYFHPYEFDSSVLDPRQIASSSPKVYLAALSNNLGRNTISKKVTQALQRGHFTTVEDYIVSNNLT